MFFFVTLLLNRENDGQVKVIEFVILKLIFELLILQILENYDF